MVYVQKRPTYDLWCDVFPKQTARRTVVTAMLLFMPRWMFAYVDGVHTYKIWAAHGRQHKTRSHEHRKTIKFLKSDSRSYTDAERRHLPRMFPKIFADEASPLTVHEGASDWGAHG